jgi:GNAT superfamily N-acetyltransferase
MGPRESYGRIGRARGIPVLPGDQVWSVVCFVIDKSVRRSGLSAQLLAAAGDFAQRRGARIVEAYPVAVPDGARVPAAAAYCGIESTFLKSGYRRVAETTSTAASLPRVVVRRDL